MYNKNPLLCIIRVGLCIIKIMDIVCNRSTSTGPAVGALSAVLEVRPTEGGKAGSTGDKAAGVDASLGERPAAGGTGDVDKALLAAWSCMANIQRLTKHFDGSLGRSGGCLGEVLGYPIDEELRYGACAVGGVVVMVGVGVC
jgi:hypothetical protein